MKTLYCLFLLAFLSVIPARAQYAASACGSSTCAAELNSKPAVQTGSTAATGNCTAGKDIWVNATLQLVQFCVATNVWGNPVTSPFFNPGSGFAIETDDFFPSFCFGGCQVYGKLNWNKNDSGGSTYTFGSGIANHPGLHTITTGATSTNRGGYVLASSNDAFIHLDTAVNWEFQWIINVAQTTNETVRVGLVRIEGSGLGTDNGMFWEFDPATNANWEATTCAVSTCTRTATAVAPSSSSYYRLSIRSTTAGTILFRVSTDGGAFGSDVSIATNVPTFGMTPTAYLITNASATKVMNVDWYGHYASESR